MSAPADAVATTPIERRASRLSTVDAQDEEVLAQLGYKQELRRDWGLMHNFGISFSIIVRPPIISMFLYLINFLVCNYWNHNPLPIWTHDRRTRSYVCGVDHHFHLYYVCCARNG